MQTGEGYLLLGQPELAEQAMRAMELKGDLPQLVDPRFQLGISVADWTDPEYRWLRRERPYIIGANFGPVAAQFAKMVMYVPPASGVIVVLEKLWLSNNTAAALPYRYGMQGVSTVIYPGGVGAISRDGRQLNANQALAITQTTNVTQELAAANYSVATVQIGDTLELELNVVLTPKIVDLPANIVRAFVLETNVVNQVMFASVSFRERAALTSELT